MIEVTLGESDSKFLEGAWSEVDQVLAHCTIVQVGAPRSVARYDISSNLHPITLPFCRHLVHILYGGAAKYEQNVLSGCGDTAL